VYRVLTLIMLVVGVCLMLGFEAFDRRPSKAFRFALSPTATLATPMTVKIPLRLAAEGKSGKPKKTNVVTTVFVASEAVQQRHGSSLPSEALESLKRQWRRVCVDALLVADGQQRRAGSKDDSAAPAVAPDCDTILRAV
jgi:hypothetical protein